MVVTSTTTDVGSMGDRKYAYGTWRFSGALAGGNIDVPMGRVDFIHLEQVLYAGHACLQVRVSGVVFPASAAATPWHTLIPAVACASGICSGLWWAFGKRG